MPWPFSGGTWAQEQAARKRDRTERIQSGEGNDWDLQYNDEPVCPFCGAELGDAWELGLEDEGVTEVECECEKTYVVRCSVTVDYTTSKPEEGGNDGGE